MCSAKLQKDDREGREGRTIGARAKRSVWAPISALHLLANEGYNIAKTRPTSGPWIRDPEGYQKKRDTQLNAKGAL